MLVLGLTFASRTSLRAELLLSEPPYRFRLTHAGTLVSVERGRRSVAVAEGTAEGRESLPAIQLRMGSITVGAQPSRPRPGPDGGWIFDYEFRSEPRITGELRVRTERRANAVVLRRIWRLRAEQAIASDLTLSASVWPQSFPAASWLPAEDGTGREWGSITAAVYHAAGRTPGTAVATHRLALPLVTFPARPLAPRVTIFADPWFSTRFEGSQVAWEYPGAVGLESGEEAREFDVVLHDGDPDAALQAFYAGALAAVPAGPEWLHTVRWVGYDYLSDAGQGWFRDIDAMTPALRPAERRRAFLCLHGWYDFLGRYCFDADEGRLDKEWVAFAEAGRVNAPVAKMNLEGDFVEVGFTHARPVKMSLEAVHQRLRYARERGFRVGLYFADGLSAGSELPGFDEHEVLFWGGWRGPDSRGRTYCRNPLVPAVRDFYLRYLRALLAEFGGEIDGLVWDETFHVPQGSLGPTQGIGPAGYADRAMLRLTDELRSVVDRYNVVHRREVAFLVSDNAGMPQAARPPSTALWAHGTYQDSHFRPGPWNYAIFPNYRNVAWSCCWWPISKWSWIEEGVRRHQAPVPVTNGWGDDVGFAEMTAEQQARVLALFREAGRSRVRLHWRPAPTEAEPRR